jgi:hypothetical protein
VQQLCFNRGQSSCGVQVRLASPLLTVCVFPANINHFVMDIAAQMLGKWRAGLAYHVPRMIAQPVIITA